MIRYKLPLPYVFYSGLLITVLLLFSGCNSSVSEKKFCDENYWKDQALKNIIPYWSKFAIDRQHGAFYTNLDAQWQTFGDSSKYPSMISRHLFGYSVAYMLSGDEQYLKVAENTKNYL